MTRFQIGDIIRHTQLCSYGIILAIHAGWDNKYCKVMWFDTDHVSHTIQTADLQKVING